MKEGYINILGVKVNNISFKEGIEIVESWFAENSGKKYIVTPNPEFITRAQRDLEFKNILNKSDLAIPDGAGLLWASKVLGKPLKEKIPGVDFMMELCRVASEKGWMVGLLGGRNGVGKLSEKELLTKYPKLNIKFIGEEWDNGLQIEKVKIDILFVAFGAPNQEKWIWENLPKIPVKVAMGVGGAFDYISGSVQRAPEFLRNLGLEWFFRLIKEPWRIKRQLIGGKFFLMVLKQRFND